MRIELRYLTASAMAGLLFGVAGCSTSSDDPSPEHPTASEVSNSSIPSSGSPESPTNDGAEQTTSLPPAPTRKWEEQLRALGRKIGVQDLNSPEPQYQSARMIGHWGTHAVLLTYFEDPAQRLRGPVTGTMQVGAATADVVQQRTGPQVLRLSCADGRYFEASVVNDASFEGAESFNPDATSTLLGRLAEAASCDG